MQHPRQTHSIRCNNLGPRPRPSWRAYPEITFLGYTLGQFYGKEGRPYIGTRPSRKAVKSLLKRIHERTARRSYADTPENTVADLSRLLRGRCSYFDQRPVMETKDLFRQYVDGPHQPAQDRESLRAHEECMVGHMSEVDPVCETAGAAS